MKFIDFKKWFHLKSKINSPQNNESSLEIELFQIHNLIQNQVPFSFYWVENNFSEDDKKYNPADISLKKENSALNTALKYAKRIDPKQLRELSPTEPVVLVCKNGNLSQKLALDLSKKWINVFYLKGGLNS